MVFLFVLSRFTLYSIYTESCVASCSLQICFDCDTYEEAMHIIYAWLMQSSVGLCQTKRCSIKREVMASYIIKDICAYIN